MKIAVIGWGSLYWDKRNLELKSEWKSNGPVLPLEFARISSAGNEKERVTLVIDEEDGAECITYWAEMNFSTLQEAKENLRKREGTKLEYIKHITQLETPKNKIESTIQKWIKDQSLDAVVWTGLVSNWFEIRKNKFSLEDLAFYLHSKKHSLNFIKEYFEKAPPQIRTKGRNTFNEFLM